MMRLLGQMIRFPFAVMTLSLGALLRTAREMQGVTDDEGAALAAPDLPPAGAGPWGAGGRVYYPPGDGAVGTGPADHTTPKEPIMQQYDCGGATGDLGGADVKNVSYWITFMKPDFVTTLQPETNETIDYATDGASFAGLKIAEFMEKLKTKGIKRPKEWKTPPDDDYTFVAGRLRNIPERDRRYIQFNFKVNWRKTKLEAEYDKDTVEALRQIRDRL